MLEIAIWIGTVLFGIALLGVAEYLRARRIIRINTQFLKAVLPIAGLMLLLGIAGGMAALFFFLYFLSDYWEYAIVFGGLLFAYLVVRIRGERSFFASASESDLVGQESDTNKGTLHDTASLAMQIGAAAAILVLMIPVLTGGFLIFMFLDFIADKIVGGWLVLLPILAAISVATYSIIRRYRSSTPR